MHWQGMKQDVKRFVAECMVCQPNKYQAMSPSGLLQPLPIPQQIWDDISMDFIEELCKSEGYNTVFVVVYCFNKYAHFTPLKHPFTAKMVARIFIKGIVQLHGIPKSIVSNRDKIFLTHFWEELFPL